MNGVNTVFCHIMYHYKQDRRGIVSKVIVAALYNYFQPKPT